VTPRELSMFAMLKACVSVMEQHMHQFNSDERRQVRRAWVLMNKLVEDPTDDARSSSDNQ
jgi:hypothetical protein